MIVEDEQYHDLLRRNPLTNDVSFARRSGSTGIIL